MENKEFYINCDGVRLHSKLEFPQEEKKNYPLVIVVHGLTGHMEEPHIAGLSQALNENGFATLRVELYGHGMSDGEFRNHNMYRWLLNLMSVVEYVQTLEFVTDLYITGHSQGGAAVVLLGGLMRNVFKAIIPLSPATLIKEHAYKGELLELSFDPDHIEREYEFQNEEKRRISGDYIRINQLLPFDEAIDRYDGQVLIVHGTGDDTVPVEYGQKLHERYKHSKLVLIPDDDHCFNLHLDQMIDAVIQFLKA